MWKFEAPTGHLVVFCHGHGGSGLSFDVVRSRWWELLPDFDFVAPNGPYRVAHGAGYTWIPKGGLTWRQSLSCARTSFDTILRRLLEEHGGDPSRVALVGFSLGASVILDAVITGRWHVAAAVIYAGRILEPPKKLVQLKSDVCVLHGRLDGVVDYRESVATSRLLQRAGASVDFRLLEALGHGLDEQSVEIGGAFLSRILSQSKVCG